MRALTLAATAALAGCADLQGFSIPDTAPATITLTWARVPAAHIDLYCAGARRSHEQIKACAVYMGPLCTIYTTAHVSAELLGHELLHCYLGAWH